MKFAVVIVVAILALALAKHNSKESSEERSESRENHYGHHRGYSTAAVTRESLTTTTGPTMATDLRGRTDWTTETSSRRSTGGNTADILTHTDTSTPTRPETTTGSIYVTPQE
ncbi:hypothetical protein ANCCAN_03220 [Ancylostoma caninum]|uniref:Uncharacterized protein n=1 Tax=Ancylostoma caninum TaxID=29170 RepID=A0A368H5R6_ANCCA|nr:hypothetical protein ANCCAN_03220 [Ancylostoma caninum]